MLADKKISTNGIMWAFGISLTLLIWALQLLGVVDSLVLGTVLLMLALLLLIVPFWRWEAALSVPKGFRALIIVMFVVIYCGISSFIIWRKYSDASKKEAIAANALEPKTTGPTSKSTSPSVDKPSVSEPEPPRGTGTNVSSPQPAPLKTKKVVKKLSEESANPVASTPTPTPTQNCPNGICIGGDNYGNPQIFNAPQPVAFTLDELTKVRQGMIAFSGRKVTIMTDGVNDETMGLAGNLKSALERAGLTAEVKPVMMLVLLGGRRPSPGISFGLSPDQYDAGEQLAAILSTSGFIPPGKRFQRWLGLFEQIPVILR